MAQKPVLPVKSSGHRSFLLPLVLLVCIACLVIPAHAGELVVAGEVTITYPAGWYELPPMYTNAYQLVNVPPDQLGTGSSSRIVITTEQRRTADETLLRLREIVSESDAKFTSLTIDGFPAIQRVDTVPLARRGLSLGAGEQQMTTRVTTAIAFGSLLVRLEGYMPADADPAVAGQILAIGQSAVFTPPGPGIVVQSVSPGPGTGGFLGLPMILTVVSGSSQRIRNDPGVDSEIEVAVSTDGRNIVVGNNGVDFTTSNDGGVTWTRGALNPGFPHDGDPSLAFGESGNFYFGFISLPDGSAAAGNVQGCANSVSASTDDGLTFPTTHNMVVCPLTGAGLCFPDQEHIAADRSNAGSSGDRLYSTWRNFVPGGAAASCRNIGSGFVTPSIVCSRDSGATWTAPAAVTGTGDVPRITVGPDGFVYVVYRNGNNIMLSKYSSCDAGLAIQAGFPVTVGSVSDVPCPVSGLDRCNDGNILSSHMVAVDDTDANHVYVAYATSSGSGNENVMVRDSTDGGLTWPGGRVVQLNAGVTGRRFMPWVCSTGGTAFVSWYDRRSATAGDNSLTEYYGGQASRDGGGNLVAGTEFLISEIADSQCGSGWPCTPRSTQDSESCTVQPQLAGVCCDATQTGCPGSQARCDFSTPSCVAPETCNGGGGCPKYGDYNGNACAAGRFYTAWASATSPAHITPPSADIDVFTEVTALNDNPPVANAGGPYVGPEASPINFDASGSSDPDAGDTLLFRWDVDSDGIWERDWSPDPKFSFTWEDDHTGTATVEVTDSVLVSSATASVTVLNVPPTATFNAPATVNEGDTIGLSLTNPHDPSPVDTAAGFTYAFDCGDGSGFGPFGSANTASCPTCDNGVRHVGGKIRDKDNGVSEYHADVTVENVAPVVAPITLDQPNPQFILPGQTVTFGSSFTDPGSCDTWTYRWSFGDGTPDATGSLVAIGPLAATHAYAAPGTYPVIVTVTDDDGGSGSASFTVHVADAAEAKHDLAAYIAGLPDSAFKGQASQRKNALGNMLDALDKKLETGAYQGFIQDLRNNIRSKADGSVDGKPGDDWITDPGAQQVICQKIDDITAYVATLKK